MLFSAWAGHALTFGRPGAVLGLLRDNAIVHADSGARCLGSGGPQSGRPRTGSQMPGAVHEHIDRQLSAGHVQSGGAGHAWEAGSAQQSARSKGAMGEA